MGAEAAAAAAVGVGAAVGGAMVGAGIHPTVDMHRMDTQTGMRRMDTHQTDTHQTDITPTTPHIRQIGGNGFGQRVLVRVEVGAADVSVRTPRSLSTRASPPGSENSVRTPQLLTIRSGDAWKTCQRPPA